MKKKQKMCEKKSNNNIFLQNRLENIICITTRDDIPAKPYEKGEVLSEAKELWYCV